MAMNNKEQAEMAALKKQLAVASAFVRTPAVAKDVPPPEPSGKRDYSHGFNFNAYNGTTEEYWSSCNTHYTSNPVGKTGYISGRQEGIALYSTRLLALKALRHAVENEAAESLAKIDIQIAAEIQAQQEGK